jgi:TonB family protein
LGKKRMMLGFKLRPMSDNATVLIEAAIESAGMQYQKAKADFGNGDVEQWILKTGSARPNHSLYQLGATRAELTQLAKAQRLMVSVPKLRVTFPVAELEPVLRLLDECMSRLLAKWGLSKADQARIASFPEPKGGRGHLFYHNDYPISALRRAAVGGVEARVTVHPDGRASDCRLVRSSGHPDIDEISCKRVVGTRFNPALDRDGKAMTSPFYFEVRWRLE